MTCIVMMKCIMTWNDFVVYEDAGVDSAEFNDAESDDAEFDDAESDDAKCMRSWRMMT